MFLSIFHAPACITPWEVPVCCPISWLRVERGWWAAPFPPKNQCHPLPPAHWWDRQAPAAGGISPPSTERSTESPPWSKPPSNAGSFMHGTRKRSNESLLQEIHLYWSNHESHELPAGLRSNNSSGLTVAAGAHKRDCVFPEINICDDTYTCISEYFPTRKCICWEVHITPNSLPDWGVLVAARIEYYTGAVWTSTCS